LFAWCETADLSSIAAIQPVHVASYIEQLALALRHGVPAIYDIRAFATAGGLVSYGITVPPMMLSRADGVIE
jgi:hypothetical protein